MTGIPHLTSLRRNALTALFLFFLLVGGYGTGNGFDARNGSSVPVQTDVDRAEHLLDDEGVPYLKIANVGLQRHPAMVAIYALAYAGAEVYYPNLVNLKDEKKFHACVAWLEKNLTLQPGGLWVWLYRFDNTYNDITIRAPWSSAFAQAVGIQAFLEAYRRDGEVRYLELAKKAALPLFIPIQVGGLLYQSDPDVWFEEIPTPVDNPSHILSGHMRVLLALRALAEATGDAKIDVWFKKGLDTLNRWLPRYDAGYWLRYDLNPRKNDLLFRFANPYGLKSHPLAVDKITLRDPVDNRETILDVGSEKDTSGVQRIAGVHWGQIEKLAGRTVRRLLPAALEDGSDEMDAPHSYFYLPLPGEWKNNLRDDWYELVVEYYDDAPANITVQMRSIAPGQTFRDLRDGDLHLSGSKRWRRWIIPVRPTDLGYWVGSGYANKHAQYLKSFEKNNDNFKGWVKIADSYFNLEALKAEDYRQVLPKLVELPKQTPMVLFSLDKESGLLLQHPALPETELVNGSPATIYDPVKGNVLKSPVGQGIVNPQGVAEQLIKGREYLGLNRNLYLSENYPYSYRFDSDSIEREPAYKWLVDPLNQHTGEAAGLKFVTWPATFQNAYNDVVTQPPWSSAFTQSLIIKALFSEGVKIDPAAAKALGLLGLNAFNIDVRKGGLSSGQAEQRSFFEEVPNRTHVLNAHILSINELSAIGRAYNEKSASDIATKGLKTLRDILYLFDTGYWFRYDQNPRKEILLQLDWLEGETSPLIDEILLQNPQTGRSIRVDVGTDEDMSGVCRLSGIEWKAEKITEGKTVRGFSNGYLIHANPVRGGTRQNTYLFLSLPEQEFSDYFDVPVHRLVIRYKDAAAGKFAVKVQAIYEGNRLVFVPLRRGIWQTLGDQKWKESVFELRPQDIGWYKGPVYQEYEVEQLQRVAKMTKDWFFRQYVQRHRHYLEMHRKGRSTIRDSNPTFAATLKLQVVAASPTYPGHGFENALDGDPNDDYTAGIKNEPGFVVLKLERPAKLAALRLHWENEVHVAGHVTVRRMVGTDHKDGVLLADAKGLKGLITELPLANAENVSWIRIEFQEFGGQPRVLLRQIEVIEAGSILYDYDASPSVLEKDDAIKEIKLSRGIGIPVSIIRLDSENHAIASYTNLWLVNEYTGEVRELVKPIGVDAWYPTGLAYDQITQELFIANYLGKDVLILKGNVKDGFVLSCRVVDPQLVGAENISLSKNGKVYAVADYDNNGVLLFDRKTNKKKWFVELPRAHAVVFDSSDRVIVASGLGPPQLIKLDLDGRILVRNGEEGWMKNGYLWPTGLAIDVARREIWVADAHLGRIRALDGQLNEVESIGGNGLGPRLFNMPYGITFDQDGSLWVADTFKSRVLKLTSYKHIAAILQSPTRNVIDFIKEIEIDKDSQRNMDTVSDFRDSHTDSLDDDEIQPIGNGYDKRINKWSTLSFGFGIYSKDVKWNPGFNYSAFQSLDASKWLALAGAMPFFSSSIYYWVQAEYANEDRSILIYGSPQDREWIVDDGDFVCPILLGHDYWLHHRQLKESQGDSVSLKNLLFTCENRKKNFKQDLIKGVDPITAFSTNVLKKEPNLSYDQLPATFQSDRGKSFLKEVCAANASEELITLASRFIDDAKSINLVYLPEIWIAKILRYSALETHLDILKKICK